MTYALVLVLVAVGGFISGAIWGKKAARKIG